MMPTRLSIQVRAAAMVTLLLITQVRWIKTEDQIRQNSTSSQSNNERRYVRSVQSKSTEKTMREIRNSLSDETTQTQEGTVPPSWRFDDYDDESKTLSNQFGEKSQMANTGWLPDSNESREMMTSQATARKDSTDKSKMSKKSDNHSNGRKEDNGENGQSNKDSRPKASKKSKDDDADEEAEHVDLDDEDDEVRNINNPLVAELKRTDRNSGKLNRFDSVVRKLLKFDLLNKQRRRVQVRKSTQSIVCRDRNNLKLFEIRVLAGPKTLSKLMRPEDALKQDSVLLQLIVPRRPPSLFSDIPSLMQSLDRIYRKRMRAFERRSGRRRSSRRRNGHHHRLYHIVSPETTYAPSSESRVRFPGESDDWLERPRWNRRKPVRWPGMRHFDWNGGGRNLGAWNRMRIALGQPSLDTDHDFDRLSSEAQRHTHEPAQTAAHSYSSDHPYEPQPLFWGWGSNSASTTSKPPVASPNQSKTIRFLLHRLFESVSPNTVLYYINRVFSDQRKNEAFVKKLVELSRDAAPTRPAVEFLASLEQPDSGHQPASQTHLELENADRENSNLSGKTSQTMMASGRKPHLNLRYYMTNLNLYNWNGAQRHRRASRWANAPIVAQNTVIDYTRIFFELIPVILALRQLFMDPDNFRLPPDTFLRQPFDRYGRPVGYPPNSPECYYNPRLCGPEIIRNEDEFLPDETEDPMQKLYAHSLSSIFKKSSSTPPQPTVQIVKATQPPSTNSPMIAVTTPAPSPPAASQQPALVSQVQPEQPELQPPQSNAQVEVASSSVASSAATSDMYAPQSEIQPTNGYAYTNSAGSELPVYAPTYGQNPYNGIAYTYVPASGYVASAESAADNNADNSNNSNNVSGYPTNPSSSSAQSRFKRSNRFSGRFGESRLKFHRMSLLATRKGFNSKLKFKSDSTRCRCKMRSSRNPHCRCVHRSFGPHRKSIHD